MYSTALESHEFISGNDGPGCIGHFRTTSALESCLRYLHCLYSHMATAFPSWHICETSTSENRQQYCYSKKHYTPITSVAALPHSRRLTYRIAPDAVSYGKSQIQEWRSIAQRHDHVHHSQFMSCVFPCKSVCFRLDRREICLKECSWDKFGILMCEEGDIKQMVWVLQHNRRHTHTFDFIIYHQQYTPNTTQVPHI